MGRLILLMLDNQTPAPMEYDERHGEPFNVVLLDEGSLTITNLSVSIHKQIFLFKTTYNNKSNYPLYVEHDYCDYLVFDEQGNFDSEFIEFCKTI